MSDKMIKKLLTVCACSCMILTSCAEKNKAIDEIAMQDSVRVVKHPDQIVVPKRKKTEYEIEKEKRTQIFVKEREKKVQAFKKKKQTVKKAAKAAGFDELVKFFPKDIAGTKARPFAKGSFESDNGTVVTTVGKDYLFTDKSSMNIQIIDYVSIDNIPKEELSRFFGLDKRVGFETVSEEGKYGKYNYSFDTLHGTGKMSYMINDRTLVTFRLLSTRNSVKHIKDCLEYVDLKTIKKSLVD